MGGDFINIKIIGVNCSNGMKLKKNINKAIKSLKIDLKINEINKEDKNKYGIVNTPAFIIDDKIINQGSVLDERKIVNILKQKLDLT